MNACGLFEDGDFIGRSKRDGCVLLGSQELNDEMKELYNDIVIPDEESTLGIGKRHFIIKYSMETKNYYI